MSRTISTTDPEPDQSATILGKLRRSIGMVAALLMGAVAFVAAAPSAFAMNGVSPSGGTATDTTTATVVHSGMLGWQITLIAVGAALVSAVVTAVLVRTGSAGRLGHAAG